jgi:hypothetical protein
MVTFNRFWVLANVLVRWMPSVDAPASVICYLEEVKAKRDYVKWIQAERKTEQMGQKQVFSDSDDEEDREARYGQKCDDGNKPSSSSESESDDGEAGSSWSRAEGLQPSESKNSSSESSDDSDDR